MRKVSWKYQHVPPPLPGKTQLGLCYILTSCYKLCLRVFVMFVFNDTAQWTEDNRKKKAEVVEDGGPFIGGRSCSHYSYT